jgi:putative heme-binding domain-containing protein
MRRSFVLMTFLAALSGVRLSQASGLEPWADSRIPVADGLILWLDASHQASARDAQRAPAIPPDGSLGVWYDGSGAGHRMVQRVGEAQPRLVRSGDHAVVRFDGIDDHLALSGPNCEVKAFTAFLVAAPRSNSGGFLGLFAGNAVGQRDYETGFTIDQSPAPTSRFESLNVEGRGFGGAVNLMRNGFEFGTFHTVEVRVRAGRSAVELVIDGRKQGQRDRTEGVLRIDELTLGARFYTNDAGPQIVRGFFGGEIAEVLLYDRALSDNECQSIRTYLDAKHAGLDAAMARAMSSLGHAPRRVENPPVIQVLMPGFAVERLPIELKNINNIRYRSDGKLVALAYNGDVYVLTDQDGDGLEDHADRFWDNKGRIRAPIGMALTPPAYPRGQGLFVASKGKCSLIVDTDGDDHADEEIVIAQGWKEIEHGVDALGVAVGQDGSIYFGVGSGDFTNAYLIDNAGTSHYDVKGERGTIQRVAADFRSREIVATGIRFPVALAFNRRGDLFATDQEGATWLANGNPFDELLHIRQGRHYGFPPRHGRYLPGVIDEPSVFDYTPQHQSTCGLIFNEPIAGRQPFGPDWWQGDALACGYSRGKLYRSALVNTTAGYLARTSLVACLNMLTVDSCVAPEGSLVVATHSGGPDWGSGPEGRGALFKIRLADQNSPQPVAVWAASPREVRIAFDRPLALDSLRELSGKASIEYGRSVAAGDRFETLRPGYAVVAAQVAEPRFDLPIRGISVSPDRRTVLLSVDPMTTPGPYSLTLPGPKRPVFSPKRPGLPQHSSIDLSFELNGVEATWTSADRSVTWHGWLPHLDPSVSKAWVAKSSEHNRLWPLLEAPGTLRLASTLALQHMLRPAVQPGAQVDDGLPAEVVTVVFEGSGHLKLNSGGRTLDSGKTHFIEMSVPPGLSSALPVELEMATGPGARLEVTWYTTDDSARRPLSPARLRLPWTLDAPPSAGADEPAAAPELDGGNWARGREVFLGETARCGQCHSVRGQGGKIGPDLSNLVHRDYASVLRDIEAPSFAINPDFVSYQIALQDGRVLSGPVRTEGTRLHVGDGNGHETAIDRTEIDEMQATSVSTMPEGLTKNLGSEALRDLLTFLLTQDVPPAPLKREGAPPPRSRAEVAAVLGPGPDPAEKAGRPLRIVLVSGPKDHGVDEHDYPVFQKRWSTILARAEGVSTSTAESWPSADEFAKADVLIWNSANPGWSAEKGRQLDAYLERGGGMVYIHYAVNGRAAPEEFAKRIGLAWRDGGSKFRHGPLDLSFPAPNHPISSGLRTLHLEDESYWDLVGDESKIDVLATAVEDGRARPLIWTRQNGRGRVFCMIPGHYTWTFDDPLYRVLLFRGIAWSASEPVDRLRELVTVGARLKVDGEPPK